VRPVIVVVEFVSAKYGRGAALADDQDAVEEFAAVLPTKRSAMAWATMRLGPLGWSRLGVIVDPSARRLLGSRVGKPW
jgi:hypothetical protein